MITCKEALKQAVDLLAAAGVPDAEIDAWYLFEHATGMNRSAYFLHKEEEIEQEQAATLVKLAEQRAKRVPLQYYRQSVIYGIFVIGESCNFNSKTGYGNSGRGSKQGSKWKTGA